MGLTATAGNGQAFKRVPEGVWTARCIQVIDLGTQQIEYAGEIKSQHKVQIVWEVLGEDEHGVALTVERDGHEVPMTISKRYTMSLHEKARMRADLQAWRGKPFTEQELKGFVISNLLGATCLLNITHSTTGDKTYDNISSITPLPRGMAKPVSSTPLTVFDLDKPDMALFATFHEKLQQTIQASAEWQARTAKLTGSPAPAPAPKPAGGAQDTGSAFDDMDSDIPFISASASFDMESRHERRMRRYG